MIAELTLHHLGGESARWHALLPEDQATALGYALARRDTRTARVSVSPATARDLVAVWNEAHTKRADDGGNGAVTDYLNGNG